MSDLITAKIIADSTHGGQRLITIETVAPKFLDAEIEKHRMISTNSSSDRAIPFKKNLEKEIFLPEDVRLNEKGMQGYKLLSREEKEAFYRDLEDLYTYTVGLLSEWDHVHKQHLNRYLAPFMLQHKIMTANEFWFTYFLKLRDSEDADPNIQTLAKKMRAAIEYSEPTELNERDWHMPYYAGGALFHPYSSDTLQNALIRSVARCARVSYSNHDNTEPSLAKDKGLFEALKLKKHSTPFEHQATPSPIYTIDTDTFFYEAMSTHTPNGVTGISTSGTVKSGNFSYWRQYRHIIGL